MDQDEIEELELQDINELLEVFGLTKKCCSEEYYYFDEDM